LYQSWHSELTRHRALNIPGKRQPVDYLPSDPAYALPVPTLAPQRVKRPCDPYIPADYTEHSSAGKNPLPDDVFVYRSDSIRMVHAGQGLFATNYPSTGCSTGIVQETSDPHPDAADPAP